MSLIFRAKRGPTSAISQMVRGEGELAFDTQLKKLYVHDGVTVGGLDITGLAEDQITDLLTASLANKVDKVAGKGLSTSDYTAADQTKVAGIAAGATKNDTDDNLKNRANHTGTQATNTIVGLDAALASKVATADLLSNGLIKNAYLPSFVDDVLEFATQAALPATGETGKIYVVVNDATAANPTRQYRWSGSAYAEINVSPGTTDALVEGTSNLYFLASRVLNTVLAGLSLATGSAIVAGDSVLVALGKLQTQITNLTTTVGNKVDKVTGKGLSTNDYTTAEQTKLGGIAAGAQVNVATNLGQGTLTATAVPLTSSTGTGTTLPAATTALAGVMSAADKTKLNLVGSMANRNVTISTAAPTAADGANGDIWLQYS